MKFVIIVLLAISSLFASILDQPFITVDNNELTVSNEAAFYTYINQLNDANLSVSYKKAVEPINRLKNPYEEKLNVKTYEDAFETLRFFYESLYDKSSPNYIDVQITNLTNKRESVINELLASNRKHMTDTGIVALVIDYMNLSREINILNINKINMYQVAKHIVRKIWEKQYEFQYNEQNVSTISKQLKEDIQNSKNDVSKAILQNKLIIANSHIVFIEMIKDLQKIQETTTWKDSNNSVMMSSVNITELNVDKKNPLYIPYIKSVEDVKTVIEDDTLNQKIVDVIFSFYKRPLWQIKLDYFLEYANEVYNKVLDYTLFVFDNNNIQVLDMINFIEVAVVILLLQWVIIVFLRKKLNYASNNLSIFIIKVFVICYLGYYFATKVLDINPTNLTIFASAFSLAFGFGMQNIIQNFVAGLIMIGEKSLKVGDSITLADSRSGTVSDINYRTTTLKTPDNSLIMVPNSKVFLDTIENKTKLDPKVRVKISFLADKDTDFYLIESILENACKDIEGFSNEPAPELAISSITKDGITVEFRLYVQNSIHADVQLITRKLYSALQAGLANDKD